MPVRLRTTRALLAPVLLTGFLATFVLAVPAASGLRPASAGTESVPAFVVQPGLRLSPRPIPFGLPVVGYHLTGRFGDSNGPWASTHTGLDFAAPEGVPITAVAAGVVVSTGYDGAYGERTIVRLGDGTELWYCHQSEILVTPGQHVSAGRLLGRIGSTGNVTGPHLHLEVHPAGGDPIDPFTWLLSKGLTP